MIILYLINSKEYSYHKDLADDFISITGGQIIDTANIDPGKGYYEIKESAPDVMITFDLAGHVFRTGNDTLSLNNIYARSAHILFHKQSRYSADIKARQNLSMFTYIPKGECISSYKASLPDIPNIQEFVEINYNPSNEAERESNLTNIRYWWSKFQKDAML